MKQSIVQIDAFTDVKYHGNPAAVCLLDPSNTEVSDKWMQSIAMEMNLAETAFLVEVSKAPAIYNLRWFTPFVEVDLCGHATLAAAHMLWENGEVKRDVSIQFQTRSGALHARYPVLSERIVLDFPAEPAIETPDDDRLLESLGIENCNVTFVGKNRFDWLVAVSSSETLIGLTPDMLAISKLPSRGVIVTSPPPELDATYEYDFMSRFFAPAAGVPEDPVTGSAHCCLAHYWSERLGLTSMVGYQASQRGGYVGVEIIGDRVLLFGKAVTTLRGELV